jgi:hypothetical protein
MRNLTHVRPCVPPTIVGKLPLLENVTESVSCLLYKSAFPLVDVKRATGEKMELAFLIINAVSILSHIASYVII